MIKFFSPPDRLKVVSASTLKVLLQVQSNILVKCKKKKKKKKKKKYISF